MANRLDLHNKLVDILGSNNVYYQPPTNLRMAYPAIIYSRSNIRNSNANDNVYTQSFFYEVIVIDQKSDSEIVERISKLPKIRFDRQYVSDNLYHNVFTIYY